MSLDRFLRWFESTGVKTEHVHVASTNESGFGLYTRRPLPERDCLVLSVPERLFVKPAVTTNYSTGFEQLIVYLLENPLDPYVDFLRSVSCIPRWRQCPGERFARVLNDEMDKHKQKYDRSRAALVQYSEDDFLWAYYAINTRCVYLDMHTSSKDQDENLCLIPFLDFVNHSLEPNTISKFNPVTCCYEVRTTRPIEAANEELTFTYNPHSNVDLFLEYGFVLRCNPHNRLPIRTQLRELLSTEQIQSLHSFHYWNLLEFYPGGHDLSWTLIKCVELAINPDHWSPYDDPADNCKLALRDKLRSLLSTVQQNLQQDFERWHTEQFTYEKHILYEDFLSILHDTSIVIDKLVLST